MTISSTAILGVCATLVAQALAGASLPDIPSDLTTPVQQRLAINGPNRK